MLFGRTFFSPPVGSDLVQQAMPIRFGCGSYSRRGQAKLQRVRCYEYQLRRGSLDGVALYPIIDIERYLRRQDAGGERNQRVADSRENDFALGKLTRCAHRQF